MKAQQIGDQSGGARQRDRLPAGERDAPGQPAGLSTPFTPNSAVEVFNRIATYAIQSAERLPVEATHMLIAGAIDFVVFIEKRNDYSAGPAAPVRQQHPRSDRPGRPGAVQRGLRAWPGRPGRAPGPGVLPGRPGPARVRPGRRRLVTGLFAAAPVCADTCSARSPAAGCCCS